MEYPFGHGWRDSENDDDDLGLNPSFSGISFRTVNSKTKGRNYSVLILLLVEYPFGHGFKIDPELLKRECNLNSVWLKNHSFQK